MAHAVGARVSLHVVLPESLVECCTFSHAVMYTFRSTPCCMPVCVQANGILVWVIRSGWHSICASPVVRLIKGEAY
jgi:hypothetical protein